jgi:mono/diheme cytochrome c family protein
MNIVKRLLKIGAVVACVTGIAVIVAIAVIQATWRRDYSSTPLPEHIRASADPEVIERGRYVALHVAHCSHCHSPNAPAIGDLSGGPMIDAGPFGRFYPTNLTPDDETGIGRRSDAEIARAIRSAVLHDGTLAPMMLVGVAPMADEDLVAVISYLRALPPKKNATPPDEWGFVARMLSGRFTPRSLAAPPYVSGGASAARGEYLVNGPALCATCHTARDPLQGFAMVGPLLAGDPNPHVDNTDPRFEIVAPNLTRGGVLASFDEDTFTARFRAGRALPGSIMPWESFQGLSEEDVRSIYRYLSTLPPVQDDVGPVRRAIE